MRKSNGDSWTNQFGCLIDRVSYVNIILLTSRKKKRYCKNLPSFFFDHLLYLNPSTLAHFSEVMSLLSFSHQASLSSFPRLKTHLYRRLLPVGTEYEGFAHTLMDSSRPESMVSSVHTMLLRATLSPPSGWDEKGFKMKQLKSILKPQRDLWAGRGSSSLRPPLSAWSLTPGIQSRVAPVGSRAHLHAVAIGW